MWPVLQYYIVCSGDKR